MKYDLSTPPEPKPLLAPEWQQQEEKLGVYIGLAVTLLIHLLLIWIGPRIPLHAESSKPWAFQPAASYTVQYEAETFAALPAQLRLPQPKPLETPPEMQFVETNPEAPAQPPDKTLHFGARDQQSAQPNPALQLSLDQRPSTTGEFEHSQKIVSGEMMEESRAAPQPGLYALNSLENQVAEGAEPTQPGQHSEPAQAPPLPAMPKALQAEAGEAEGLASFLETGDNPEILAKQDRTSQLSQEKVLEATLSEAVRQARPGHNGKDAQDYPRRQQGPGQVVPLPRPTLVPRIAPGPLRDNPYGVTRSGMIAWDANFSEYGEYLQRMFDAVAAHWNQINLDASRSYAEVNSRVVVDFVITREGRIKDLRIVHSTADALRTEFCREAILARAPYGEWSKDMVLALGSEQPIRFTFYYY